MKNKVLFLASMAVLGATSLKAQLNVGSASAANPSAILQATSTTKGFLPPSMTNAQRNLIATPAYGLLIYNTDTHQVEVYTNNSGTAAWGASSTNIYTANGTLGSARTITQANYPLNFKGGLVNIDSSLSVDASGLFGGTVSATTGSILRFGKVSAEGIGSKRTVGGNVNGLDFYTAGNSRLSIVNAGNVGIGTQAPAAGLDVANNMRLGTTVSGATTDSILTINSSTGIVNKRSVVSVVRQNTDSSIYSTDGILRSTRTVTQAGNALNLKGGLVNIDSSLSVDASGLFSGTVTATTGSILRFGQASTEGIGSKRTAGGNANGLDFYTAGNSRLSIVNAGNVGIGTQTPAAGLDVANNMRLGTTASGATTDSILTINSTTGIVNKRSVTSVVRQNIDSSIYSTDGTLRSARTITQAGNALNFNGGTVNIDQALSVDAGGTFAGGTVTGTTGSILRFGVKNTSSEGIGSNRASGANSQGLDFYTAGNSRVSIANGGNVGIGTQAPAAKLDVNGNMRLAFTAGGSLADQILTLSTTTGLVNSIGSSYLPNIYNSNGTLTGSRGITQNGYPLYIQGGPVVTGGAFTIDSYEAFNGTPGIATSNSQYLHFGSPDNSLEGIGSTRNTGANINGLDFFTAGNSRLSITNLGKVGIGTKTPVATLDVNGTMFVDGRVTINNGLSIDGSGNFDGNFTPLTGSMLHFGESSTSREGIGSQRVGNSSNLYGLDFYTNNTSRLKISNNGTIQADGNIYANSFIASSAMYSPQYITSSDRRLKTNLVPLSSALSQVMQLAPYSYSKKNSITATNYTIKEMGFIAQDIRKIFPDLVVEGTDSAKTLSVNYTALIPVLTKAIQEQQVVITDLKKANVAMIAQNQIITVQLAEMKDLKIAMAAMQTELSKIALVNKGATNNIVTK